MQTGRRKPWPLPSSAAIGGLLLVAVSAQVAKANQPFESWTAKTGRWRVEGDVYCQTHSVADCRSFAAGADWGDYVYEVKARKTGGSEGFLIIFRAKDHDHFYWWKSAAGATSDTPWKRAPEHPVFRACPAGLKPGGGTASRSLFAAPPSGVISTAS